ncbi:MAG: PIN domain-containing protein [bacterium]|nr:PIN domain-containing protein [bacterium]
MYRSADIAIRAGGLGQQGLYGDPADRLIVATAIEHGVELVTKDRRLRSFAPVRTVW